jgi:predicted nucleic acid-binding protein
VIVVDTQMLVYMTTDAPEAAVVRPVRDAEVMWASPPLWQSEFRNAMLGLVRAGRLTIDEAREAFEVADGLLAQADFGVDTEDIFELAEGTRLTAYDLEFVALARRLAARLVTFDRQVLTAFPAIAMHPRDFAAS